MPHPTHVSQSGVRGWSWMCLAHLAYVHFNGCFSRWA